MKTRFRRIVRNDDDDDDGLSKAQVRKLQRQLADLKDPTRFIIEAGFGRGFRLYYNVGEDTYGMNDPAFATLFKRRKAALAIQKLLSGGAQIVECKTRLREGKRVPILAANMGGRRRRKSSRGRRRTARDKAE